MFPNIRKLESHSVTVRVLPDQITGPVVSSDDPRLPVGTPVGLRLADFEGISEPSATVGGVILPIVVLALDRLPDGSQDVTFELLEVSPSFLGSGGDIPENPGP
ncbi:hypothetical protein [Deinococcus aetherius]|uniref:hypothetical protein n=1 Tax=Deinococcus aetherius TaxID=200252 RepID=UPI00222FCA67|nr:hypothetical protein [Deinococcus aetherius]